MKYVLLYLSHYDWRHTQYGILLILKDGAKTLGTLTVIKPHVYCMQALLVELTLKFVYFSLNHVFHAIVSVNQRQY
jgi:hypothetical protein